jgi:hypothetical protein
MDSQERIDELNMLQEYYRHFGPDGIARQIKDRIEYLASERDQTDPLKLPFIDIRLLIECARGEAHSMCDPRESADRVDAWLTSLAVQAWRDQQERKNAPIVKPMHIATDAEIAETARKLGRRVRHIVEPE